MKGYGNPIYGAGMGNTRNLNRNQGKAYGRHGYNNNGAQPLGGYNNGYGHAGLSLGPRYGNKGIKGPQQGSRAVAGQGSKPNGNPANVI
ncbi:hyphally-regulated protein-like [Cynoglossus semilaevis]|uniref:hyphally-regulated protein-like n=1 Tax=Cynoglossus semilaevis TaxID=244447 RepID=UPI000D625D68|nr:hyphally-regulated protein-like [Cynoglossus semilaevis]